MCSNNKRKTHFNSPNRKVGPGMDPYQIFHDNYHKNEIVNAYFTREFEIVNAYFTREFENTLLSDSCLT